MWWQRVNLSNTRHSCRKWRTYGASWTYKITVVIWFPNKLLGNNVHNGISIWNNRIKLSVQSTAYFLRKNRTIHFMSFINAYLSECFIGILDYRRTFVRSDRRNLFTHISNHICIFNNYLICLFWTEIFKFLKHFICCLKVKRRLSVKIFKAAARLNNCSVYWILRI